MESMKPVINIEHLCAGYDHEQVLEDINLQVFPNDFIGLIGPNGGGKTTLIKLLLGLIEPNHGRIEILGQPIKKSRHLIGYVPQLVEFDRSFPISVWEVVRMGLLGKRGLLQPFNKEDQSAIEQALRQVNMYDQRKKPIGELSGGQRQRVYIARALVSKPKILLLDEPTASIDPETSSTIYELLREINQAVTIILISHDMNAVSSYVKTIGCLNRTLIYHGGKQISEEMLQKTYRCPVDLIAHGLPHRVLATHTHVHEEQTHD